MTSKKVLDAARKLWGDQAVTPEQARDIDENFERVKNNYRGRKCRNCGHREASIAWSPVPLVDMAAEAGLDKYSFYAYTMPLLQAHPTFKGTLGRLDGQPGGPISWGDRVDHERADRVLRTAHALLLHLLDVQIERFPLPELKDLGIKAAHDYNDIWVRPKKAAAASDALDPRSAGNPS